VKLVLASGNRGKLVEMREILTGLDIELIAQGELGVVDVEETGATFVENAILKARHAARITGLAAMGDDSGICVDALHGAPGLRSARYAGEHGNSAANIAKLLGALQGVPETERTAHFICVVVMLRHADDPAPLIAEGRWHGRILDAPCGNGGFGYDPAFRDPASGLSAAQLDSTCKNRISHRGQALARLRALIEQAR
jgi:XTP/dITP diphosphohydrolase